MTPEEIAEQIADIKNRFAPGWIGQYSSPEGWDELVAELNLRMREIDPDYELNQVKEKFGGLRYYFTSTLTGEQRQKLNALAHTAEAASLSICQVCGKHGAKQTTRGWVATLCPEDMENREAHRQQRFDQIASEGERQ